MRKFFATLVFALFLPITSVLACTENEIDVLGDGTQCEPVKFSVTTTTDATTLSWRMTAMGPFYVDCGDGGNLTQNTDSYGTLSGKTITRTGTSETKYTCAWDSAGAHKVRFGGTATGYSTGTYAAISFYGYSSGTQTKVASIDGSLGAMFPVVNGNIPRFDYTFRDCTNLTQIPAGLFSGIDTSSASYMFRGTFYHCTNLTQIPAGLFSGINTSSAYNTGRMFEKTFYNCTSLTQIPDGLFDSVNTSSATSTSGMFYYTFYNCTNLTQIPAGLFGKIDTSKSRDTSNMFYETFRNCTNLTGYIPPTAFPKTIKPGTSSSSDMWYQTFSGTNLATTCPARTTEYNSGFENDWGYSNRNTTTDGTYRVSCACPTGQYDDGITCAACTNKPSNSSYTGTATTNACPWTCDANYFNTGTQCEPAKFSVTTTPDTTTLKFSMGVQGTFYIDCGDDGVLTNDPSSYYRYYSTVSGGKVTRSTSNYSSGYICTWPSAGAHKVLFDTESVESYSYNGAPVLAFSGTTAANVASIDGSLGAMFPVVNGNIPRFYQTFSNTQITAIPAALFSGINTRDSTDTSYMFYQTFSNTQITSIPDLFSAFDTSSITNASYMFSGTFSNTQITAIPTQLFWTFDTSSVTNASYMFNDTFRNTQITAIPAALFTVLDTISVTNASYMFSGTFADCTNLTQIPDGLFDVIDTTSATNTSGMFSGTFRNCTNLTGYIPPTTFTSTIKPGSSLSIQMWYQTFSGTNLATTCPAGTAEYDSGFQNDWGYSNSNTTTSGTYRVSCEPCGALPEHATYTTGTCDWTCNSGYLLNNGVCVECDGVIYNGRCRELCPVGNALFHAGQYTYPLWSDKTNVPSPIIHIRRDANTVCYVYMEPGMGDEHGLKMRFTDGNIYHAIDPRN